MAYTFTLSDVIPATPEAIYSAWLDSRGHSAMTGDKATASTEVGGAFTAWDGYISGRNVQLVPNARIVQTWRTTAFTHEQQYSTVTVLLTPVPGGTRVTLTHANVPDDHQGYENGGWHDHYFTPMKAYFAKPKTASPKAAKPRAKAATAKAAKAKSAKAKPAKAKSAKARATKGKTAKTKTAKTKMAKAVPRKAKAKKVKKATSKTATPKPKTRRTKAGKGTVVKRKAAARKAARPRAAKRTARVKKRK